MKESERDLLQQLNPRLLLLYRNGTIRSVVEMFKNELVAIML